MWDSSAKTVRREWQFGRASYRNSYGSEVIVPELSRKK
jgi:hypothetical protein